MTFGNASRSEIAEKGGSGAAPAPELPLSVRVDARLRLHLDHHAGATRIADRHEAGAFRFRFPRAHGRAPEAILVNIAGGLAGGDRVTSEIVAGEGASLAVSSAAAERIYRSAGETTRIAASLTVAAGAGVVWLPQETILHDGARLDRRVVIDLAAGARLVFGEMLFFGRRASGEGFGRGYLRESWRVRRAGRLVLADETRLGGDFSTDILRAAALGGHVAMATLLFAEANAGEHLEALRALLPDGPDIECGASDLGGLVLIRFAASNAARLRRHVVDTAEFLVRRVAQPLPRALSH